MMGAQPQERLLVALAEQLKLPLLQIARGAELAQLEGTGQPSAATLQIAQSALQLIDSFLLGAAEQGSLVLEPVSLSALVTDTAHELSPLAKQYGCDVRVSIGGRYGPVMAHSHSLRAALSTLAYSFIGNTADEASVKTAIVLGVHKSPQGMVAGVFAKDSGLSSDLFKRAKALYGTAAQPLAKTSASSSAGVFIADSLLHNMAATLRVAHHKKMAGLATTLLPSQQLRLGGL